MYFLDQGAALGPDFEEFKADLDLTNDMWRDDDKRRSFEGAVGDVFERIRPFTVRETKSTAGIELPEKRIENVTVTLSERQRKLYDEVARNLSAEVVIGGELVEDDSESVLKRLLRLVQVASNPGLLDESYDEVPAKAFVLGPAAGRRDSRRVEGHRLDQLHRERRVAHEATCALQSGYRAWEAGYRSPQRRDRRV